MQRAEVNFRDKEARVIFDPARVSVDQLIRAVKDAGFRASPKGSKLEDDRGGVMGPWIVTARLTFGSLPQDPTPSRPASQVKG